MVHRYVYLVISLLVLGDVLTTHVSSIVMGEHFGELGFIANFLMRTFGDSWAFLMFPIEFAIFGIVTYYFSRGNGQLRLVGSKKLPVAYMPAIALSLLILNNSAHIVLFVSS